MKAPSQETVDCLVIGCGIAGAKLADYIARAGYEVIVLEKRPSIGLPIRCAEATGSRAELSRFININERWISADINAARLVSPGGVVVEKKLPGIGVVLRRDIFDLALAQEAGGHGADIRASSEATGLEITGDVVSGARVRDLKRDLSYKIRARVTVGADGIESHVGRWCGLRKHLKPGDLHSCYQYLARGEGIPRDVITIYVGRKTAPGGYIWVFPKGEDMANIGVGIHPGMAGGKTPREYLDDFIKRRFPGLNILSCVAGGTSGLKPLPTMVGDGVLLVGEAACQNNPFSGGGIMNALEGAQTAAEVLIDALSCNDLSRKRLGVYDLKWHEKNGRTIAKFAALRRFFVSLNDGELDSAATVLRSLLKGGNGIATDYAELFKSVFCSAPGFLLKAGKLLW